VPKIWTDGGNETIWQSQATDIATPVRLALRRGSGLAQGRLGERVRSPTSDVRSREPRGVAKGQGPRAESLFLGSFGDPGRSVQPYAGNLAEVCIQGEYGAVVLPLNPPLLTPGLSTED
jgi:hypothetical protein